MFEQCLKKYLGYIKNERKLTPNTIEAYIRDLIKFREYLIQNNIDGFDNVNRTVIITYLLYLQKDGKSVSTISRNLASIRCYCQYLLNNNLVYEDPTYDLRSPKPKRRIPSILSRAEIDILLSQANEENYKSIRDRTMLELLYATGIRVSEIIDLNMDNLRVDLGDLELVEKNNEARIIPIGDTALKYLIKYIFTYREEVLKNKSQNALFLNYKGDRLTRQGFWKIIKEYAEKSNINKKITPHTLRHSFAVHLLQNGADMKIVQKVLGHSDLSTTQSYSFAINNELKTIYKMIHTKA